MNLTTITVTEDEATAKLAEYEAVLAAERRAEDAAIAQAYRAAKRGQPVIALSRTIAAGGHFESGLPRIAIVRADATTCVVHVDTGWRVPADEAVVRYTDGEGRRDRAPMVGAHSVTTHVPAPEMPRRWESGRTVVPLIPPHVRPRRRNARLGRYHVLWEVEAWDREPPRDPALVRYLRGDLWCVLATWELTELERAVLGAR